MKNGTLSSRAGIVQRSRGQSAVEKSAYISRTSIYSEYCGVTFNRTAKEDLVGEGVILPDNAPPEYADRKVLWNSVENNERSGNAQLARTLKYSLPNEWDETTAKNTMERFIKEQFADKGMCADYGIHRSQNERGQPNLHIHIMLTLRPINEDGTWGAKSRKEYITDRDGNRIPNASGKGYKSRKVETVDWNSRDKAKEWRNAIADTINAANEQLGIKERIDARSYREREIPLIPTIHLGEKASALERKGIKTERGNINRAIEKYNSMIMKLHELIGEIKWELKKDTFQFMQELKADKPKPKTEVQTALETLKSQRAEMAVRAVFPYIQKFKDKRPLANIEQLSKLIEANKLETWGDVRAYEESQKAVLEKCSTDFAKLGKQYSKWTQAVCDYEDYKQYQPIMKEYQALSGLRKNAFKKKHETELEYYAEYRDKVKAVMPKDMKISKPYIDKQLAGINEQQKQIQHTSNMAMSNLARLSVFKGNLREIENEQNHKHHEIEHTKRKDLSL